MAAIRDRIYGRCSICIIGSGANFRRYFRKFCNAEWKFLDVFETFEPTMRDLLPGLVLMCSKFRGFLFCGLKHECLENYDITYSVFKSK